MDVRIWDVPNVPVAPYMGARFHGYVHGNPNGNPLEKSHEQKDEPLHPNPPLDKSWQVPHVGFTHTNWVKIPLV